jgi:hypothetical protein
MAKVHITNPTSTGGGGSGGNLQLASGASMTTTLTAVTDTSNTASPLLLSTTGVQVQSPLRITTSDASGFYIDAEDSATNNRFSVKRDPSSQLVTVDFASNPAGSTTAVGAIRTYVDGVNLSEVMTFREDGNVGINTTTPGAKLDVHSAANVVAQFNRTGAGKSWIQFLQAGAGKWNIGYDNTNGNYTIYDVVNSADRMVVTNAGNIGIGTTSPTNTFEVASTSTSPFKVATTAPYFRATYQNASASGIFDFNSSDFQFPTNNVDFGTSTALGATVGIKGSGSTSATTSLLVQNSSALTSINATDDGTVTVGTNSYIALRRSDSILIRSTSGYEVHIGSGATNYLSVTTTGTHIATGSSGPVASAQLQVDSTVRGFLPPRMTTAQKNAIATPAAGLMVYDTTLNKLCVYTTAWETITSV